MHRHSARGLFDSVVLPTFPPASAQSLPPPSSCLPLFPCRCYHSSSSHINYIPLPLSKPGPELLLTSIPLSFLPCLWLVTWLTGRLMSTFVMEGWGWIAWRLPHTTIRLGNSQASVVNTVHSYTQQLAQKNKLSLGIGGFTERGLALSVDRKVTCSFFKKHGFPM